MKTFDTLHLHPKLLKSLEHMKYTTPTPIQAQSIPLALKGRDIMGSAQTGTGKTAAFSIPIVQKLLESPKGGALILTPTRELGKQIMGVLNQMLGPKSHIKTAFIIGGESMSKQFGQLRQGPRLIVGTPGRINDHLERGSLNLSQIDFLVLDETDRMLDMGFTIQLEKIFKFLPDNRQTLMFSATLPDNIMTMSKKYMNNPERIAVGHNNTPIKNIKQDIIRVDQEKKYGELVEQLNEREGTILIFAKTKHGTDKLAKRLGKEGFSTDAIHGDLKQSRRQKVINDFRNKKYRILVATDVVARGLDIPHIKHVINYDLPQVPEDYIHRIGRTARAGAEGEALCLVTPQDGRKWHAIQMLIDPEAAKANKPANSDKKKRNSRRRRPNGKVGNPYAGKPSGNKSYAGKSNAGKPNTGKPNNNAGGAAKQGNKKRFYGPKRSKAA